MNRIALATLVGLMALPLAAAAETWKGVSVIDTLCVSKVTSISLE